MKRTLCGNYFHAKYKEKIKELVVLQGLYKQKTDAFLANVIGIQNEFNPSNLVSNIYLTIQEHFNNNSETITDKIQNSNERNRY